MRLKEKFLRYVKEYISEAEHQDGSEYWDTFDTVDEVANDFYYYVEESEKLV